MLGHQQLTGVTSTSTCPKGRSPPLLSCWANQLPCGWKSDGQDEKGPAPQHGEDQQGLEPSNIPEEAPKLALKPQALGTDVCAHLKPRIQSETFDEPANPGRSNNNYNLPCPRPHAEQPDDSCMRIITFYRRGH